MTQTWEITATPSIFQFINQMRGFIESRKPAKRFPLSQFARLVCWGRKFPAPPIRDRGTSVVSVIHNATLKPWAVMKDIVTGEMGWGSFFFQYFPSFSQSFNYSLNLSITILRPLSFLIFLSWFRLPSNLSLAVSSVQPPPHFATFPFRLLWNSTIPPFNFTHRGYLWWKITWGSCFEMRRKTW